MTKLEQDYILEKEIKDAYHAAKADNDEQGVEEARKRHGEHLIALAKQGDDYRMLFDLYESMKERGNEQIDIDEPYLYRDIDRLLSILRENEIEQFTFSSTWSSAVKTAWELTQKGCTLEGMTEINSKFTDLFRGGYERIPAYVFRIG